MWLLIVSEALEMMLMESISIEEGGGGGVDGAMRVKPHKEIIIIYS